MIQLLLGCRRLPYQHLEPDVVLLWCLLHRSAGIVSPKLKPATFNGVRGLAAGSDIAFDELLVSVPRQAALTLPPKQRCPCPEFVNAAYWDGCPWFVKLAVRSGCHLQSAVSSTPQHQIMAVRAACPMIANAYKTQDGISVACSEWAWWQQHKGARISHWLLSLHHVCSYVAAGLFRYYHAYTVATTQDCSHTNTHLSVIWTGIVWHHQRVAGCFMSSGGVSRASFTLGCSSCPALSTAQ